MTSRRLGIGWLEQASALIRAAREEGWSAAKLDEEIAKCG